MTIIDKISELREKFPLKTALIDMKKNEKINFTQLDEKTEILCKIFFENGVKFGDKIVVFVPIGIEFYLILIAFFKMGVQAVFIDPYANFSHINKCCEMILPDGIIGSKSVLFLGSFLSQIRKISKKIDYKKIISEVEKNKENKMGNRIKNKTDKNSPALISFTSGSTGFPKIILRTHDFLLGQHNVLSKNLSFDENSSVYSAFPMFLLSHMACGLTTVIPNINFRKPIKTKPENVILQIEKEKIENLVLPPSILENVVKYLSEKNKKIDCIKKIYTGGAPVFPQLMQNLKKFFPNGKIRAVYGASEVEPISILKFEEVTNEEIEKMKNGNGLLVGKKVNEIDLKIEVDENDDLKNSEKAFYNKGEILVNGENVLKSYLNVKNTDDKWLRTGDTGYFDENQNLVLLGRKKAKIKINNKIYYPFSVETAFSFLNCIKKSVLAEKNKKLYLIVEKSNNFCGKTDESIEIRNLQKKFEIDYIIFKKVPVDKRHNSKVDYRKLEKLIKNL